MQGTRRWVWIALLGAGAVLLAVWGMGQGTAPPPGPDRAGDARVEPGPGEGAAGGEAGDGTGSAPAPGGAGGIDAGDAPAGAPPSRQEAPEAKEVEILIEGMPERVRARRFEGSAFWTYHPEDMIAETAASEEGEVVQFVANFGGKRNDDAYINVFLHREDADEDEAMAIVESLAVQFGLEAREEAEFRYDWVLAEYGGTAGGTTAWLGLGRHGGRFFHVLVHYPSEYGDGFAPRLGLILDQWRWKDTGAGL